MLKFVWTTGAVIAAMYAYLPIWDEAEWVVKLLARLHLRRAVWTEDYKSDVVLHFLRRWPNGQEWCHRCGMVGEAVLLEDGTVRQPNYMVRWGYWPEKKK